MNKTHCLSVLGGLKILVALLILFGCANRLTIYAQQVTEFRYTKKGVQIGYNQRSGDTEVSFTRPMEANLTNKLPQKLAQAWERYRQKNSFPGSYGKLKVETKGYGTEIETTSFVLPCRAEDITEGLNTYVLWVINPTGAIENKAEVLYSDTLGGSVQDSGKANAFTTQPVFAMMITAEPHFAVLKPSRYVILVSDSQASGTHNAGKPLGDAIIFNPSAAPFEVDPQIKQNVGKVFDVRDRKVSDDVLQVRNVLNQAQYSIAMAETVITNIGDITALNLKPTSVEAEKLLGPRGQSSYASFKETVLARLRETLPVEFNNADNALKEAKKFYQQAAQNINNVHSTVRREDVLPISLLARFSVQSGAAAQVFANYAFAIVELARTRAQLSLFIKLSDQLSEELNYLSSLRSDLDGKLNLRAQIIEKLRRNQDVLNNHIGSLNGYVDTVKDHYNNSLRDIKLFQQSDERLRKQLNDICEVLNNLIGNLGEIIPAPDGVVIRLKSDILFQTGEYLFDECSSKAGAKSASEEAFDFVVADAELRRQIADARQRGDEAAAAGFEANRRDLSSRTRRDVRPILAQLSTLLRVLYKNASFKFIGHTDKQDNNDYNLWLSQQRALEVARIFFAEQLELMNGTEKEYQEYLEVVKTANLLLYKRKSDGDKNGYSQFWPANSRKPGGNLKADAKQTADRGVLLNRVNLYIEGKGEEAPVVDTPDGVAEVRNRRVEIEIKTSEQNFCSTIPPRLELKNFPDINAGRPELEPIVEIDPTEEISIPVAALDTQTQQNVTNLRREQVRVFDCPEPCNDGGRELQDFSLEKTKQPLRVAIMIDESARQQLSLGEKTSAATAFVSQLTDKPNSEDKAAILSFSRSTAYRQTLTGDKAALTNALAGVRPNSLINGSTPNIFVTVDENGSALYDAVIEGSLALTAGEPYRKPISQKAIVLMTDGRDRASINRIEDAIRSAIASSVRIYAIGIPGRTVIDGKEEVSEVKEKALQELCTRTGGRFFPSSANLSDAFRQIEADLRTGYVITYTLPDNRAREVYHRISIKGPDSYRFFYREGYFDR
jgi:VWFA-related protein